MESIQEAFAAAVRQFEAGKVGQAEQSCRQILALDPNCASAWNFLGVLALKQRRYAEAAELIQAALRLQPQWADAHNNLGLVLHEQGQFEEAAVLYRRALELNPNFAEAHHNLGLAIHDHGWPAKAIEHYRRSLAIKPDYANAHVNLANALKLEGNFAEAIFHYRRALAINPHFAEAVHNLGSTFQALGQYEDALACYEQAVQISPDFAEAHKNLSQLQLLRGDFEHGWPRYEWRWKTGEMLPPAFAQPPWNGEPLIGKTILLHAEQGLGDVIQFVRYAPLVSARGGKVVVLCPKSLMALLSRCKGIDQLVADAAALPPFDYHAPLLSLPRVFHIDLQTIPANVPYLSADPMLIEQWKTKLKAGSGFRVGVNWRGRGGEGDFRLRDMPLENLAEFAKIPGVELISLQRGEGRHELLSAKPRLPIEDFGDQVDQSSGAFMDTAAIMKIVDLVITSDTAVAHLAGALAVPVWLGLPFVPNWRWLLQRSDSPWYPTMRLFRQESRGDWDGVIAEMRRQLEAIVLSR